MVAVHIFELQDCGITWQVVDMDFQGVLSTVELERAVRAAIECFEPTKVALFRYFNGLPKFKDETSISLDELALRLEVLISLLGEKAMAVGVLAPDGYSIIFSRSEVFAPGDTVAVGL